MHWHLRDHRSTTDRNIVFLRGIYGEELPLATNRARARRRARALAAHNAANPAGESPVMENDD